MKTARRRTELLLAAAALLISAVALAGAGVKSALAAHESTTAQQSAAQPEIENENPFEAGENAIESSYVIGYTGVAVYPPGETPDRKSTRLNSSH